MDSEGIEQRLQEVKGLVAEAEARRDKITNQTNRSVLLVAVSKLQSIDAIVSAYRCGQRVFGENYIQELCSKCCDEEIRMSCPDIEWHMIGHIQTNKVNQLLNAFQDLSQLIVETIDSIKMAETMEKAVAKKGQTLRVFVQINTSEEENKNGINSLEALSLVKKIVDDCPHLKLVGLMTIGRYGHDSTSGPNPDFAALIEYRDQICGSLGINKNSLELSFGMTSDFEEAIMVGSTEVRIGTAIFGQRVKNL